MKIVFYSHDAGLYGATRSLLSLIEGLKTYGVECLVILSKHGDIEKYFNEKSISFAVIPHYWWVSMSKPPKGTTCRPLFYKKWIRNIMLRLVCNIKMLPKQIRFIKQFDPDFIYTNTSTIPMGAIIALLHKTKHVWHLREFVDLLWELDFGIGFFKFLLCKSDAVIVNSDSLRNYISNVTGVQKIYRVYNGIAFKKEFEEKFKKIKKINEYSKPYTFGMVGKILFEKKGQDIAVHAISLLKDTYPDIKLVIAGDGDIKKLKQIISKLNVEAYVKIVGFIYDPYELYYSVDAVLMCSKYEEFGRVTVEAMSACLPVVGCDNTGTKEIVQHEHTGLLYQGGPATLAKEMERLINNPSWARQLGINGWRVAREKYNNEVYCASIYNILKN